MTITVNEKEYDINTTEGWARLSAEVPELADAIMFDDAEALEQFNDMGYFK